MLLNIEKFAKHFDFLSASDIAQIMAHVEIIELKKGAYFAQAGEMCKSIGLIQKGLFCCYYIKENGEEVNVFFRWEGKILGAYECIIKSIPSSQYIQALEDCVVLKMDFEALEKLYDNNRNLERAGKILLQNTLAEALQKIESFIVDNPETRYLKILKEYPELNQRIPNKFIASFLGITPVSLSRIRKRLQEKKN